MWVGGKRHAPAALPPGDNRYWLYKRLDWLQDPVWTGEVNLALNGIRYPDRPARSKWLHRLSCPGPGSKISVCKICGELSGPLKDCSRNTSFFPCQFSTYVLCSFVYLSPALYVNNLSNWRRLGVASIYLTAVIRNVAKEEAGRKHFELRNVVHEMFSKTDRLKQCCGKY
jgi:hypothetical protein